MAASVKINIDRPIFLFQGNDCDIEKDIRCENFDIFICRPRKWAKLWTNWGKMWVCGK